MSDDTVFPVEKEWIVLFEIVRIVESFLAIKFKKLLDEFLQVSLHHLLKFVNGKIDSVIGDSSLWEVVGSNSLASVSGTDQGSSFGSPFFLGFSLHLFQNTSSQNPHRLGPVFMLAFFILALDHRVRRKVSDSNR